MNITFEMGLNNPQIVRNESELEILIKEADRSLRFVLLTKKPEKIFGRLFQLINDDFLVIEIKTTSKNIHKFNEMYGDVERNKNITASYYYFNNLGWKKCFNWENIPKKFDFDKNFENFGHLKPWLK